MTKCKALMGSAVKGLKWLHMWILASAVTVCPLPSPTEASQFLFSFMRKPWLLVGLVFLPDPFSIM